MVANFKSHGRNHFTILLLKWNCQDGRMSWVARMRNCPPAFMLPLYFAASLNTFWFCSPTLKQLPTTLTNNLNPWLMLILGTKTVLFSQCDTSTFSGISGIFGVGTTPFSISLSEVGVTTSSLWHRWKIPYETLFALEWDKPCHNSISHVSKSH